MKLLVLVTDAFGGRGGIAKFNRDLLGALSADARCDEVIVLPRVATRPINAVPPKVDFRLNAAKGTIAYAAVLMQTLGSNHFDGIVCGHLNLLPLAALAARARRTSLLLITHGVEAWQDPRRLGIRDALKRVDTLVSVSRTTQERFLAWSQIQPRHCFVAPNCVDQAAFGAGPKDRALIERYNLDDRIVLLTLGRLSSGERYKGIDELLALLPRLGREVANVSYLIVGDGDDRPRLEALAQRLGVSDRVVFTGFVREEDKAAYYRLADVFVMVGKGEGFGIAYLESLACGIPVVASLADASREAVLDGLMGELADPDSPNQIREAILRALRRSRSIPGNLQHFSVQEFRRRWQEVVQAAFVDQVAERVEVRRSALRRAINLATRGDMTAQRGSAESERAAKL